eukprot:TRINITY_DN76385_c0_g1_i1.p1 TRINITY_DN76385_c0_g1~~TRINITY_DN76385_c0_g1_i1.p1  ORF type:complete len:219 (-),score=41.84 TRINITY_DN76385_c0_g1_i1:128-784(-)
MNCHGRRWSCLLAWLLGIIVVEGTGQLGIKRKEPMRFRHLLRHEDHHHHRTRHVKTHAVRKIRRVRNDTDDADPNVHHGLENGEPECEEGYVNNSLCWCRPHTCTSDLGQQCAIEAQCEEGEFCHKRSGDIATTCVMHCEFDAGEEQNDKNYSLPFPCGCGHTICHGDSSVCLVSGSTGACSEPAADSSTVTTNSSSNNTTSTTETTTSTSSTTTTEE